MDRPVFWDISLAAVSHSLWLITPSPSVSILVNIRCRISLMEGMLYPPPPLIASILMTLSFWFA
jgi:hypothetical protein